MSSAPHPLGEIKTLPLKSLTPSPDNPRIITGAAVDLVAQSISRFGWQQPIVVDADMVIIAGHTRHRAAQQLRLKTVPVVVADNLTPEEVRAYRIADNRTGDFSSWDFPELVSQLDDLSDVFSDVLGLADWEAIVTEFEETHGDNAPAVEAPTVGSAPQPADEPEAAEEGEDAGLVGETTDAMPQFQTADGTTFHVPPEADAQLENSFEITVVCDSENTAVRVQLALLEMDGVLDARHKR